MTPQEQVKHCKIQALVVEMVDGPSTSLLDAGDAIAGALLAACALDQPLQEGLRWRQTSLYPEEEEWDERRTNTRKIRFRWGQEEAAEVIQHVGAFQC